MGGVSNFLASIDPGPAIGGALAEVDKTVNREIPGGWYTVGGLAAGGTALYFAPEIMAFAAEAGITPAAASIELGVPAVDATGALVNPATGLAWEATGSGLTGSGAELTAAITSNPVTPEMIAAANASSDPIGMMSYLTSATPEELAAATGAGAQTPVSIAGTLKTANTLAKLVSGVSGLAGGKPTAQQYAQFQQANQPLQEQFGGLYRMNQNPFAQTQQAASVQNPFAKTQDFLAQLSEESKPEPTLADLLRNA